MIVTGKAFKYGDNVDTDVIIPARYLNSADPEHLKQHCMEDIDPSFAGCGMRIHSAERALCKAPYYQCEFRGGCLK